MYYISQNTKKHYIWGFEEPENSLEYNYSISMAECFANKYCSSSMIFVTSHSPAFINIENINTKIFRCFRKEDKTTIFGKNKAINEPDISEELGYIELQKELHNKYIEIKKNNQILKNNSIKLEEQIKDLQKSVIITEGKTDSLILNTAWNKLFDNIECPYIIRSCDILDDNTEGSAAGCDMLSNYLCSFPHNSIHLAIGIFDRDEKGINAYKLSKNYKEDDTHTYKYCKNKKSFSFLLPIPPEKEDFAKFENLCTEYYFNASDLRKTIDGKGLILKPKMIEKKCNGKVIEKFNATEIYLNDIDKNTKTYFAEKIVPTLPKESFSNFKFIFDLVKKIIDDNLPETHISNMKSELIENTENNPQSSEITDDVPICVEIQNSYTDGEITTNNKIPLLL